MQFISLLKCIHFHLITIMLFVLQYFSVSHYTQYLYISFYFIFISTFFSIFYFSDIILLLLHQSIILMHCERDYIYIYMLTVKYNVCAHFITLVFYGM